MNYSELVGKIVQIIREKRGISQAAASQILEMSQPSYSKIETGKKLITIDLLKNISGMFEMTLVDLVKIVEKSDSAQEDLIEIDDGILNEDQEDDEEGEDDQTGAEEETEEEIEDKVEDEIEDDVEDDESTTTSTYEQIIGPYVLTIRQEGDEEIALAEIMQIIWQEEFPNIETASAALKVQLAELDPFR